VVRFDTYNASAHLVRQLESSGVATVTHDGGDTVLVKLTSGHEVSIHLIETIIPPYELKLNLIENAENDIYSLFVLWGDMFLPHDNEVFQPDPWMHALMSLYNGKLYAFDVYGKDIRIFPTYFEPVDLLHYRIHYGGDVDVTKLGCGSFDMAYPDLSGSWLVADFTGATPPPKRQKKQEAHAAKPAPRKRPPTPWEILGIAKTTERDEIKRAYRRLARRYHPDLNPSREAHDLMQALNNAYQRILDELDAPQPKP
jgi:hypothetical protein